MAIGVVHWISTYFPALSSNHTAIFWHLMGFVTLAGANLSAGSQKKLVVCVEQWVDVCLVHCFHPVLQLSRVLTSAAAAENSARSTADHLQVTLLSVNGGRNEHDCFQVMKLWSEIIPGGSTLQETGSSWRMIDHMIQCMAPGVRGLNNMLQASKAFKNIEICSGVWIIWIIDMDNSFHLSHIPRTHTPPFFPTKQLLQLFKGVF